MSEEEIPVFSWNTETKEFYVLGHKFDGVNSIEDFINYITDLERENKELKADLEMYENGVCFSSENDKLQNEIDNLNHIIDKQDKDITILSKGNKHLKEVIDKAIKCVYYNTKYRNGADIYQFVDIESEILEPLQDILEQNDNSNNAYLKEFNDWLKEVE